MTPKELKDVVKAAPFRPFRIRFGSNETVDVRHREMISLSPSGRTAVVYTDVGSFEEGDSMQIIDVMLVEALEFLPPGANGTSN